MTKRAGEAKTQGNKKRSRKIYKNMRLNLSNPKKEKLEPGAHVCVFADVVVTEPEGENGFHKLKLMLETKATRRNGKRWVVPLEYTLNPRGRVKLQADIASWRGTPLSKAESDDLDPEDTFLGKTATVLMHEKIVFGKEETVPGSLLPPGEAVLTVSPGFVREHVKKEQEKAAIEAQEQAIAKAEAEEEAAAQAAQ
jgi:hypothetical protein